jgi:hypothetical protein
MKPSAATPLPTAAPLGRAGRWTCALFALVWIAGWTAIVGGIDFVGGRQVLRQWSTAGFLPTPGRVTRVDVQSTRHKNSETHKLEIAYEYVVDELRHRNAGWNYLEMESSGDWAQNVAREFPAGSPITVYYNPADPDDSLLEPGPTGMEFFGALFLMPFNVVMFVSWAIALLSLRKTNWRREVQVLEESPRTVVRMRRWNAMLTAAAVLFVGGLFAAILLAITTDGRPSLALGSSVFVSTIGLAVAAAIYIAYTNRDGRADLIVDPRDQTVELPAPGLSARKIAIAYDKLVAIRTEAVQQTGRRGQPTGGYNYFTQVVWHDRDQTIRSQQIKQWNSADAAENFAAWLNENMRGETRGDISGATDNDVRFAAQPNEVFRATD